MITRSEKRRAIINDLLIGLGLPVLQMCARECACPFTCQPVVYKDAIQNTLFRRIVTMYMKILALTSLLGLPRQHSFSSTRGPWRSVVYPSFIAVSVLACYRPLVPCLIGHSHDCLHLL